MTGQHWASERIDELKKLRDSGLSYALIARELGCSRNSAIGLGNRLKLPSKQPTTRIMQTRGWRDIGIDGRAHPLVRRLIGECNTQQVTIAKLGEISGCHPVTIYSWNRGVQPTFEKLIACFNAIGFDLVVARMPSR